MAGKNYLKVAGVLMAIIGIGGIVTYGVLDLILGMAVVFDRSQGGFLVILIGLLYLAWSIFDLFAGIYGVKHSNDADKAGTCHSLGIISILIVSLVYTIQIGLQPETVSAVQTSLSLLFANLIPLCYLQGAVLNLKERKL